MNKPQIKIGVSFSELLLVLFIGLKLGGIINWSWWWVMAPLWIPAIAAVVGGLLILLWVYRECKKEKLSFKELLKGIFK